MSDELKDSFRGDDAKLVSCIAALVAMEDKGILSHSIGGHARELLSAAAVRLSRPAPAVQVPEGYRLQPHSEFDAMNAFIRGETKVPPFYALVPVEPTPESLMAMHSAYWGSEPSLHWHENSGPLWRRAYDAMLAAAPAPATVATEAVAQEETEDDVAAYAYSNIAEILEPYIERDGNPDGFLPASVTDSVQMLLEYRLAGYDEQVRVLSKALSAERDAAKKSAAQGNRSVVAQSGGVDVEKVMALVEEYKNRVIGACIGDDRSASDADESERLLSEIRALLTAAPAGTGGWIPVGERRPGVGVVVLGFWKNSAGPHSHVTGQNYGITARNEHGLWYDASEDDNEDDEWMRPDYWQPLPAAPAIANHREVE